MLEQYLTMSARLKVCGGVNDYGEPSYTQTIIKCRLVDKFKEITDDKGNKIVSSGVVQTLEDIKVGDFVNDRKIISVISMTALDGPIGYKGYLL